MLQFTTTATRRAAFILGFAALLVTSACGQSETDPYGVRAGEEDQVFDREGDFAGSHILVAYQGALRAAPTVTRTKEEALAKANALIGRLGDGEDFTALAKAESDGPSATLGGNLGAWTKGRMVPEFDAAMETLEIGEVTQEPVETDFGYHVIRREPMGAMYYTADIFFIGWAGAAPRVPETITRDSAAAAALADSVGDALTADNFDDLAAAHNDLSEQAEPLPTFVRSDPSVPAEVRDVLEGLAIGEVAGPVATPYGFAFLRRTRVVQRRAAHILLDHDASEFPEASDRSPEEARALAQALIDSLEADPERFAEFARTYSADRQAMQQGGDLGPWFKGGILPEFEGALDSLEVGETRATPLETPFGFHVIRRLDPKVPLVAEEAEVRDTPDAE